MKYFEKLAGQRLRDFANVHEMPPLVLRLPDFDLKDGKYLMWGLTEGVAGTFELEVDWRDGGMCAPVGDSCLDEIRPMVLCFLSLRGDAERDVSRGPRAVMLQAIGNLSAVEAVSGDSTERFLVMHYWSGAVPLAESKPAARLESDRTVSPVETREFNWRLWADYRRLRDRAEERHLKLPRGKLYSHLRLVRTEPALRQSRSLHALIDEVAAATGSFNYRPYSYIDARDLAKTFKVDVREVDDLGSLSSVVRVFQKEARCRDCIVVRRNLPAVLKTFLVLYELCHILCEMAGVDRIPEDAEDSSILCLPHDSVLPDSELKAEMFALVGLLPVAEIVWEFSDAVKNERHLARQKEYSPELVRDMRQRLVGLLHESLRNTESARCEAERAPIDFVRRLRSVLGHRVEWTRALLTTLGDQPLSQSEVGTITRFLRGAWDRLGTGYRRVDFSSEYQQALGKSREALLGLQVLDFADKPTRSRFHAIRERWKTDPRPVPYFFGFLVGGREPPVFVTQLLTWPVVDEYGKVVGSLAIFDRMPAAPEPVSLDARRLLERASDLLLQAGSQPHPDINGDALYARAIIALQEACLGGQRDTTEGQAARILHRLLLSTPYESLTQNAFTLAGNVVCDLSAGRLGSDDAEDRLVRAGFRPFPRGAFLSSRSS